LKVSEEAAVALAGGANAEVLVFDLG
jgi:hypothetical protein